MTVIKVSSSAPGKVILHGEHAVVYGRKAIACAIDSSIQVTIERKESDAVIFELSDLLENFSLTIKLQSLKLFFDDKTKNEFNLSSLVKEFLDENFKHKEKKLADVALTVCLLCYCKVFKEFSQSEFSSAIVTATSNNLPIGAGLGSSSALGVALSAAMLTFTDVIEPKQDFKFDSESLNKINSLAFSLEEIVHGKPSGIDNSVATHGGAVVYENGKIKNLKNGFPEMKLLVVDSGVSRNTKLMVAKVRNRYEKHKEVTENIISSIHGISEKVEELLENEENEQVVVENLRELIDMNHHLLCSLGVGHPRLDAIHAIAESHGYASKLTGAGGGGCAIILIHQSSELPNLKIDLENNSFKFWEVRLGFPGVKITQLDKT